MIIPFPAHLMPRDLDALPRQLAEDPRGEQPQAGAGEQLGGRAHRVGVSGQVLDVG